MTDPIPPLTPQEQAEMKLILGERRAAMILAAAQKLSKPPEGELTGRQDPQVSGAGRATTQVIDPRTGGLERLSIQTLTRLALDPQIGAALEIIKLPILTVRPEFLHPDRVVREFLQNEFDRVRMQLMRDLLTALEYGFVAAEKLFGYADRVIADPNGTVLWSARAVVYERIKPLHPAGIQLDTGPRGEPMGFKQIAGADGVIEVPEEKALIYTHGLEFGNRYGNPRTRRAYVPWWWQQLIYQFANRYFEDQSIPQRKIFYEPNPQPSDPNDPNSPITDPNQQAAAKLAEESRSGAAAVLPLQAVQQPDGSIRYERGWDLEYLNGPNKQSEFTAYIDHLDLKKLRAMFVPEKIAATSATGGGAYNMVETLTDFFLMSEEALLEELLDAIAKSWARPLIDYNFGPDVPDAAFAPTKLSKSNRAFLQDLFKSTILPPLLRESGPVPQIDIEAIANELKIPLKTSSEPDTVRETPAADTPDGVDEITRRAFSRRPRVRVRLEDIPGVRKPRYNRTWETMAAEFQQAVAEVYDEWLVEAARALKNATPENAPAVLDAQLAELERRILNAYRANLPEAHSAGYGDALSPQAIAALAERMAQAERIVKEEVLPALKDKLYSDIIQAEVDPSELDGLIRIRMGILTRAAGGQYWSTLVSGWVDRRRELEAAGRATKIRWRLDDEASHCPDCVAWAGEYDSVDQLPAIPGDGTSQCGWNCRCWLEEYNPETGEWQRRIADLF